MSSINGTISKLHIEINTLTEYFTIYKHIFPSADAIRPLRSLVATVEQAKEERNQTENK